MASKLLPFLALVLTALALVPAGAHLFALPNKIGLDEQDYFTVQSIYRGWALLGAVLLGAILANFLLALRARRRRPAASPWALAGFLLTTASLGVFFLWVYPANQATENWTVVPPDWQALRQHWEYGHAASALLIFAALCSVTIAALRWEVKRDWRERT